MNTYDISCGHMADVRKSADNNATSPLPALADL